MSDGLDPITPRPQPGYRLQDAENRLSQILSYLVFQAEHMRLGLEITACIFLYYFLQFIFPWEALGVPGDWFGFFSWFFACGVLVILDQFVLCRPLYIFRRARYLDIAGSYEKALQLLEHVHPSKKAFIPFPRVKYHLERTKIFAHAERFPEAEAELSLAKQAGLAAPEYHLARSLIFKAQHALDQATQELKEVQRLIGTNPVLLAEEGILQLHEKKDYREARKLLKQALEDPQVYHIEQGILALIVTGYFEVTRLWTGEAEEGLAGLSHIIAELQGMTQYNREFRPYVAALFLERGYYYATHRAPERAITDVHFANSLCAYPHIKKRTAEIREELTDRFQMKL